MTVLTIARSLFSRVGLPRPDLILSSAGGMELRAFEAIVEACSDLAQRHAWEALTMRHTFTTVAAEAQSSSAFPSDFGWIIPETIFNRTLTKKVIGPLTEQEWQKAKATVTSVVDDFFTIAGGTFYFLDAPNAGDTIAYSYVSKNWARTAAAEGASALTADDDYTVFDEEMVTRDALWRFKEMLGLEYGEQMKSAEGFTARKIARDGGMRVTRLARSGRMARPGAGIPEGSWSV